MLARYRMSRAQGALFDLRGGAASGYDEFVDAPGNVRPAWQELAECVGERGRGGLDQLRAVVRGLVDNDGITYVQIDPARETRSPTATAPRCRARGTSTHCRCWCRPRTGTCWNPVWCNAPGCSTPCSPTSTARGGRSPAGCCRRSCCSPIPATSAPRAASRCPAGTSCSCTAATSAAAAHGDFLVNADWTQAPSGAGYALADRRVVAHAIPDLYERIGPRPASPWAQALRLALIDAAPESAEEPVVVVLSPGIHSETAFDQAYLASVLGFPLVESADLVVRDGKLWMRSLGTLKRVDVVLRRVDADYADPLDLRADSRLGVVGLVEVLRRGAVTVVNTLGSGILESPGLLRFLPRAGRAAAGRDAAAAHRAGCTGVASTSSVRICWRTCRRC